LADRDEHDDDQVGFASAASLSGRRREPVPAVDPALPAWARETPVATATPAPVKAQPGASTASFGRRGEAMPLSAGAMTRFTTYALILLAVPSLGLAAVLALLMVWRQPVPDDDLLASHMIYQQRTLWVALAAGLAGLVLILVGAGIFVLFAMAVWVVVRGAAGIVRLQAGQPIPRPEGWWV